jgi:hypothetical protein
MGRLGQVSDFDVPVPEELPLAVLIRMARREVEDGGEVPMPALSALHRRPSWEVFARAAALVSDSDRRSASSTDWPPPENPRTGADTSSPTPA